MKDLEKEIERLKIQIFKGREERNKEQTTILELKTKIRTIEQELKEFTEKTVKVTDETDSPNYVSCY